MVTTLKENKKLYNQHQFYQSKVARKLYHNVGYPTVENFKHLLRQNMIDKFSVTTEDVDIYERIFGTDMGEQKYKTTRQTPKTLQYDTIEIPHEIR